MNQYKKKMYDLAGPKTVEALNKRRFEAYYCSTAAEAVEKVLELTPKTDVVSWGGAMTVDELGIKQRMAQEGYTLLDRDTAQSPEEKQAIMRQALTCGTFLMSSNAISKDGQLVNIDGNGNRVAAMCFGGAPHQGRSGGRGSGSVSNLPKRGKLRGNHYLPPGNRQKRH